MRMENEKEEVDTTRESYSSARRTFLNLIRTSRADLQGSGIDV
jgi:hypothetical protein